MSPVFLPQKLKDDCIVEAICELRFTSDELPEIVIGRLSDHTPWQKYSKNRLPAGSIPEQIRAVADQFKFQPVLELREAEGRYLVKVGADVISFHNIGRYGGWAQFLPNLEHVCGGLFAHLARVEIKRLGFRYVNAITSDRHHISDVNDLDLNIKIAGTAVQGPINLNYLSVNGKAHSTMTRIASPQFVTGKLPDKTAVVVDVDVFSPDGYFVSDPTAAVEWMKQAHDLEKEAFFKLLPRDVLTKLVEK